MTDPLVTSEAMAGIGLAGLGVWAALRQDQPLVWRELHVPRDLERQQVEALVTHVAVRRRPVLFVIDATPGQIRFLVGAPQALLTSVASALAGIAPEVRLDPIELPAVAATAGARAWWSGRPPVLRTDAVDITVAGLLGSLAAVGRGERVQLVVRLSRAAPIRVPAEKLSREAQAKLVGSLLCVEILVSVTAQPTARAHHLIQAVLSSLRTLDSAGSRLRVRRLKGPQTTRAITRSAQTSRLLLSRTTVLSPAELVPIIGLPVGSPRVTGVSYGTAPRLMPSDRIPAGGTGRTFARSDWPTAAERLLVQPPSGAASHALIVGPTGVGKSTLVVGLALDDARQGRGLLLLDLKGDSAHDFLELLEPRRHDDVIVLEPASGLPMPGLRVFGSAEPELAADLLLGTFRGLFKDSWGVLSDQYLRLGLATLAHDQQSTLADLPVLFGNPAFRARVLRGIADPILLGEWQGFEALSAAQQIEQLASPLRKVGTLIGRRTIRGCIAQASPRFDLRAVLASSKIVVVALPPGPPGRAGGPVARQSPDVGALLGRARPSGPERAITPAVRCLPRRAQATGAPAGAAGLDVRAVPRYGRRFDDDRPVGQPVAETAGCGGPQQRRDLGRLPPACRRRRHVARPRTADRLERPAEGARSVPPGPAPRAGRRHDRRAGHRDNAPVAGRNRRRRCAASPLCRALRPQH